MPPDDGGADATADVAQDAGTDVAATDVASEPAPQHTVSGQIHFLQPSSSVVLQLNGGGDITVNQNGSFGFATTVAEGQSYAVTVKTQPPNQVCSARNGTGNGTISGDVSDVLVECTVAVESSGTTLGALGPAKFSSDVAGKALLFAMFPEISYAQFGAYVDTNLSLALDGRVVAAGSYGNQPSSKSCTETLYAIVDLPAGNHQATASFSGGAEGTTFPMRVVAVVLDSLSTFSQVATVTSGANSTSSQSLGPVQSNASFATTATSPVLSLFEAFTFLGQSNGGSPGPTRPTGQFQLLVDSTPVVTGHEQSDIMDEDVILAGLGRAPSGTHSLVANWAATSTSVQTKLKGARADAVVLTPSAHVGTLSVTGDQSTTSSTFVTIPSLASISLSPSVASQILLLLTLDGAPGPSSDGNAANSSPAGAGGQVAFAVDNAVVGGGVVTHEYASGRRSTTLVQLVPVNPGTHTIQAQYKATATDIHTGPGTSALSAILIE